MLSETCVFCGSTFKVPDDFQGKKVKCPKCKELLGISARAEDSAQEKQPEPEPEQETAPRPTPIRERRPRETSDEPCQNAAEELRFEGEELVLETKPSVAVLVVRVAAVVIVCLTVGGLLAALPLGLETLHKVTAVLVCVLLGIGIGSLIAVEWASTVYMLTSSRVISRRGIMWRRVRSCPLEKVGHIVLKAGPFARMLGMGAVRAGTGAWGGWVSWRGIDDPQAVANLIAQHVDHRYAFLAETDEAFRSRAAQA